MKIKIVDPISKHKRHQGRYLFLSLVLLIIVEGCAPQQTANDIEEQSIVESRSSVAVPNAQDESSSIDVRVMGVDEIQAFIASLVGKIVVVDVWATTCEPCIREFPGLVELDREKSSEGVIGISVNSDFLGIGSESPEDHLDAVKEFLANQVAGGCDNLLSGTPDTELFSAMNIESIPVVFVYGRDGGLIKKFGGAGSGEFSYESDIVPLVESLIEKESASGKADSTRTGDV